MPEPFDLRSDFIDSPAERGLLAAIARDPGLYWELLDFLPKGTFTAEQGAWREISGAIQREEPLSAPPEWIPADDPRKVAEHLADYYQRRLLAGVQARVAKALYDEERPTPAQELAELLEEEAARVQSAIRESQAGRIQWASDLIAKVLEDAEQRFLNRKATGKPVMGLPTGLSELDTLLGGLEEGLYILGGGPGTGKTTMALQIAAAATKGAPVVYFTFENSPANLAMKAIAAMGKVEPRQVMRGWVEPEKLRMAAELWRPVARKLALIEGSGQLTMAQVRAKAMEAMNRHKADRCLIVVDYLQLWAKAAAELRGLTTVRERVEVLGTSLRELSTRLSSPVLALSSQNRSQGSYGGGKGSTALDSLKESGDLEYAADVVMFLTRAENGGAVVHAPHVAVDLTVAKNRNGETGAVNLIFMPNIATIAEMTQQVRP